MIKQMPRMICNFINGEEIVAFEKGEFPKISPVTGEQLCTVSRSNEKDVLFAVSVANEASRSWSSIPPVQRGLLLHKIVTEMISSQKTLGEIVASETGKSLRDALGEVGAAIQCGLFFASEGQRLYGKTTTSGVKNKFSSTIRKPIGIAGLIISANTPIANIAWKVFPALICGNSVVLKASEDAPETAWFFAKIAHEAGLPAGVFNVIHGFGEEVGDLLVSNENVGIISFTGSTNVGKSINKTVSQRLAKVSLELGGKNALVVCDDADLDNAVSWTVKSSFSNAGQRCAASSRIIVFEKVYDKFKSELIRKVKELKIGVSDGDDLGPVINKKQQTNILRAINDMVESGAQVLIGGKPPNGANLSKGCFIEPTIIEGLDPAHQLADTELFGPVTNLYKVSKYSEALAFVNNSKYGLTASIHTQNFNRANHFIQNSRTGVVVVNGGTHGSEPHMPFGGYRMSGNGSREPGTEAIDVYSELCDVYINIDDSKL